MSGTLAPDEPHVTAISRQLRRLAAGFTPAQTPAPHGEQLRAVVGALAGILLTGVISRLWMGDSMAVPMLIAPMGASAVLLFAVPSSPLAQPWSLIGGNTIAAVVGVCAARWIDEPMVAAAVAVAATIGLTAKMRCLHPPAGAVALTAVVGGPLVAAAGFSFVFVPVLLNTALLLGVALLFHAATGAEYPAARAAATSFGEAEGDDDDDLDPQLDFELNR